MSGQSGRAAGPMSGRSERAAGPMSGRSERGVGISRRALLVWAVGVFVYIVAVFHRSSLAVAGVTAQHRFGIGASVLALFSVAQLAMYAGMQIPVGVLLDRFGSRRLLMAGAALMAAGQLAFALASDVWLAIGARLLIGIGDAMTFISVLRLVALWFPPRRNPIFVQLTGVLGQLGSLASAVPVVVLLRDVGWTATYLGAAGLSRSSTTPMPMISRIDATKPPTFTMPEALPSRRAGLNVRA